MKNTTAITTHLPTGTKVICNGKDKFYQNKAAGLSIMKAKLYAIATGGIMEEGKPTVMFSYLLKDDEQYPEDVLEHRRQTKHVLATALPFDVARCHGEGCSLRDTCKRYIERFNTGERTPSYASLMFSDGSCLGILKVENCS